MCINYIVFVESPFEKSKEICTHFNFRVFNICANISGCDIAAYDRHSSIKRESAVVLESSGPGEPPAGALQGSDRGARVPARPTHTRRPPDDCRGDEFAYWPQPEKLFELLGGRTPDSRFAILSTPNGEMNQFHEMYETALEHILLGDNVYTAHFFPWFVHEEYSLSANSEQALLIDQVSPLLDLDSDETSMMASQGLTEDQIRWRRFKSSEMEQMRQHGETRILFSQEFPEDDTTCFLTFGDMAYDAPILDDMFKSSKKPIRSFLKADIWYDVEKDVKYLVAIDPGEGRTSMTAITVWTFDRDKEGFDYAKHCATIHGLYPPERTAELVRGIAVYYNWATVAPEVNISTLAILLKNYPNKYMLKDPLTGRRLGTFGWPTTPTSKPLMTNELRMMLPRITCHDTRIIKEIRNMRVDQRNERRVISTGLDDLHDSVCIAMMCRSARPTRKGFAFSTARKG